MPSELYFCLNDFCIFNQNILDLSSDSLNCGVLQGSGKLAFPQPNVKDSGSISPFFPLFLLSIGIQNLQPGGLPRSAEKHTLDPLDPYQYYSKRGPPRAALPLHLSCSTGWPPWLTVWQKEDRESVLPQRWLRSLRHRLYVLPESKPLSSPCFR